MHKSLIRSALALLVLSAFAPAAGAQQPPVIDRELFFGNPEISGAQLSPDGKYIAFIKPWKDTRNIWVKKTAEPFSAARLVTAEPKRPIPAYFWTRNSKFILFVQDNNGDENYNVYSVNPADVAPAGQDAPAARNLTAAKGARAMIYSVPKNAPDTLYIGLNDRDAAWHDLYKVQISTGERSLVRKNTEKIAGWVFDEQGQLRLAVRTTDNGGTEILNVAGETLQPIYSCSVLETCGPSRFHKDGKRFYAISNKGNTDLVRLVLIDAQTGAEETVESDPLKRVDLGNLLFSDKTDELTATAYEDERIRYYFRDKTLEADYTFLTGKLPGKDISFASSTADEELWLIAASGDTEPGVRYLYDRRTKSLTQQYKVFEKLPREALAPMTAISYKSSDGLVIPAFLTLPKGIAPRNLPLMVVPHGGPWSRDTWGYDPFAQFLANRGYAVLQPNFRSSTGYGKVFLNAGNNQWGDKMQDDLTWGVKHLVAQGIADPKRVGIMGGSYGGYATLAGAAFTPDVYAAAVSIVGPSNLITLLETIPPYWEAGRTIFYQRMGNPTTAAGKAQLQRQSPLNSADKIRTPLLIVQGANDPRVKKAESDQIVVALRERRFPVEYLVAPDEGHGFQRPVNNMAMFAAAEKFLAKYLNGRYQADMKPEVATRLTEITVDPRTVSLEKPIDVSSVAAPEPAAPLQPGTFEYADTIVAGPQKMAFTSTVTIREDNGGWVVAETARMPQGEVSDITSLEPKTLIVKARSIKQGPVAIELSFAAGKATGSVAMGGQTRPVDVSVGGPLFADGAGAYAAMATLPLKEGYSVLFRNFDVQKQKATIKRLSVSGSEKVTVPAGTFDTWKVEIASAEGDPGGTTVWIEKDSRKLVKMTASLPQMGGATITSELQK